MIEILGYIFATILALIAALIVYHVVRGLILGIDRMRWQLIGISWAQIRGTENWKRKFVKMFLVSWSECIGYNGSITLSRNGKTWCGYGTGR